MLIENCCGGPNEVIGASLRLAPGDRPALFAGFPLAFAPLIREAG